MPYELAALSAAASWAVGGLIAAGPTKTLGGPRFTRSRMVLVTVVLVLIATTLGTWNTVQVRDIWLLAISGFVGLALGDVALFTAFSRLGPRRTGILFAMNAPMAAGISAVAFGERFSVASLSGSALIIGGVVLAIAVGTRPGQSHSWEDIRGNVWMGVGFGLLGALGQAVGVIFADPAFDGNLDPWAGAAIRAAVGTLGIYLLRPLFERNGNNTDRPKITPRLWGRIIASAMIGMVIGKTMVLIALADGDPGIVSVLVATSTVIQLPVIWAVTRQRPAGGAWLGALAATIGTALIVV